MVMLTVQLLQTLLRSHIRDFYSAVGTDAAQFDIPRTGRPRLRVAVPAQYRGAVPSHAMIAHAGETIDVPIELEPGYEEIVLH